MSVFFLRQNRMSPNHKPQTHKTNHLHKGFPQRETAIMTAGVWGSPKKKYLRLHSGISYLVVHSCLHKIIEQQGIDA